MYLRLLDEQQRQADSGEDAPARGGLRGLHERISKKTKGR